MTRENRNIGAEHGIEARDWDNFHPWAPLTKPGEGYEGYEEARVEAEKIAEEKPDLHIRIVVYSYFGLVREHVRSLTTIS